jgi:hypothetical protein
VHLAQALPGEGHAARFDHGLATLSMFSSVYADEAWLTGPSLTPSAAPGLGIQIDDTRLESFRL